MAAILQPTQETYEASGSVPHMMHFELADELDPLSAASVVQGASYVDAKGRLWVGVCTGGDMECRAFDLDELHIPLPGEPGFEPMLHAGSRVVKSTWKTARRYLLRDIRRATGIQDLTISIALTPKAPQLIYNVKHGSPTHKAVVARGKAGKAGGKTRLKVDKPTVRSPAKKGHVH